MYYLAVKAHGGNTELRLYAYIVLSYIIKYSR